MNTTNNTLTIKSITKLLAILLFGGALFIFSIGTLNAKNSDKTFNFPETLSDTDTAIIQSSNGKYMMQMEVWKNNEGVPQWIILVWDTQTGKSKFYNKNQEKGTVAAHNGWNMPASPL